jgi:hypothetical protein
MAGKRKKLRGLTAKIMSNVRDEELRYAVLQYARKDSSFKEFLHLRFLHLMPDDNPSGKYASFLSGFLRKYLDRPDKLTTRASLHLVRYFEELRQQAKDLISGRNYIEAYGIFINLLLYNSLLIEKTAPDSPEELTDFQKELITTFSSMLQMNVPRPLLLEIERELHSLLMTGSIHLLHPRLNPLDLLLKRADSDERRFKLINDYIDHLIENPPEPGILKTSWTALLNQALNYETKATVLRLLEEEVLRGKEIYKLAFEYQEENMPDQANLLIDCALKHYGPKLEHYFLEPRLLNHLKHNNEKEAADSMKRILNAPHPDPVSLKKLLRSIDSDKSTAFTQLAEDVTLTENSNPRKLKILAIFLSWMNRVDRVFELLKNQGDVWSMIEFNSFLYPEKKEELYDYYLEYLTRYLDNHIGRMSVEHISKLLSDIRGGGMYELADKLDRTLKSDFSHRKSLVRHRH